MWPTDNTIVLLIFGLLPLLYVTIQILKHGLREATSLQVTTIIFLWIGYHFSPWYGWISGSLWDHYLLVPEEIDDGLLFSVLCMILFLIGYRIKRGKRQGKVHGESWGIEKLPRVKGKWIVWLSVISLILLVVFAGGIDEVWRATYPRGEGQFEKKDLLGNIRQSLIVLYSVVFLILSIISSLYFTQRGTRGGGKMLAIIGLLIASLRSIHSFSRAAGIAFIILAYISMMRLGKRSLVIVLFSLTIVVSLGNIGYYGRDFSNPGIGNFIDIALESVFQSNNGIEMSGSSDGLINPLDAMAPWTRKQSVAPDASTLNMVLAFIYNLNPVPSTILAPVPIGPDLAEVMGTVGRVGLTTPALAELFFVFGWFGSVFWLLIGLLFGALERRMELNPSVLGQIALILCFVSIPAGLHQPTRPMTRLILYAIVLLGYEKWRTKGVRRHVVSRLPEDSKHRR